MRNQVLGKCEVKFVGEHQKKFVNHCIDLAANPLYGKDYANWAVKNFAKLDPFQLSNLHALILQELKARAANE